MNINSFRVFGDRTPAVNPDGRYVLYWMQINRRLHDNFALEYAVAWANKLGLPLVIHEAVGLRNRWGSPRFYRFMADGVFEHERVLRGSGATYVPYLEIAPGGSKGLMETLAADAALVVGDEYPVYIIASLNRWFRRNIRIPYITVDSNGIIPLGLTEHAPYSAYVFRRTMQRYFVEAWEHAPAADPLASLKHREPARLPEGFRERWPLVGELADPPMACRVGTVALRGTTEAGRAVLDAFVANRLVRYGERHHPDEDAASGLSPWLHFGKISAFEVARAVLATQPHGWRVEDMTPVAGKREGFFGGHPWVESFMDELVTWRETGFHHAHHEPAYDKYESLPDWARATLDKHRADPRPWVYTYEQFENGQTHDAVWNAAQRQLREEGIMHNYLRMLWGKKLLEWSPDPRTALDWTIELNNTWALDGRDPNSYSGIFWCYGRFDRPWAPERPVFGSIRYMSTESTLKKLRMKEYLKRWG